MSIFDDFGNILIPHIMNNKSVMYCPRDGTSRDPKNNEGIFSTVTIKKEESIQYKNTIIKNAPYDPTCLISIDEKNKCSKCGSKYFKHLRLGVNETSIKVCVGCR
jgi:hypothetical protein